MVALHAHELPSIYGLCTLEDATKAMEETSELGLFPLLLSPLLLFFFTLLGILGCFLSTRI